MKTILRSQDFSCPSCTGRVEQALRQVPGVTQATVHFATGRVVVDHDPAQVTVAALVSRLQAEGYTSRVSPF